MSALQDVNVPSLVREAARTVDAVKVYGQGKLLNVFEVPRGRPGIRWDIFTIHGGVIGEVGSLHQD